MYIECTSNGIYYNAISYGTLPVEYLQTSTLVETDVHLLTLLEGDCYVLSKVSLPGTPVTLLQSNSKKALSSIGFTQQSQQNRCSKCFDFQNVFQVIFCDNQIV